MILDGRSKDGRLVVRQADALTLLLESLKQLLGDQIERNQGGIVSNSTRPIPSRTRNLLRPYQGTEGIWRKRVQDRKSLQRMGLETMSRETRRIEGCRDSIVCLKERHSVPVGRQ